MAKNPVEKLSPKKPRIAATRCTVLHLDAGHDTNGNPRRLFLVLHLTEGIVAAVDEGYYGASALDRDLSPKVGKILRGENGYHTIKTTPSERRDLLKQFGPGGPGRKEIVP